MAFRTVIKPGPSSGGDWHLGKIFEGLLAADETAAALVLARVRVGRIAVLRIAEDEDGRRTAAEVGLQRALHAEDGAHGGRRAGQGGVIEAENVVDVGHVDRLDVDAL